MAGKRRKSLLILAAIVLLAFFGVLLFIETGTGPVAPLPNPNGYDDFLKAGAMVSGNPSTSSTLDHAGLTKLISSNQTALNLLQLGLTRQCAAPITNSALTNVAAILAELPRLRVLAQLLAAKGQLAEMEGRPADAARSYADVIRLGNEVSKGGLMINRLLGIAIESTGYRPLVTLVPQLSCEQTKPVIASLERIDENGVKWEDILRTERRFTRHQLRQMNTLVAWVANWPSKQRAIEKSREKHYVILARVRLVAAELALRCYRSAHGNPPDRLEQLTPEYLDHTLLDPFSNQLLAYRRQGTNWLLYSFGVDRVDDGGKPVGRSVSGTLNRGDLFYDSPW
ncbi:MAG TPA: hypothetical protein VN281_05495 [Verrucomicrobiae bacterium]|nr:hypothetical protein [Verrucomicrobiae bacterium]